MLTIKEICALVKVHRTTLWRWINTDQFPKPKRINGRLRWQQSEVARWMAERE